MNVYFVTRALNFMGVVFNQEDVLKDKEVQQLTQLPFNIKVVETFNWDGFNFVFWDEDRNITERKDDSFNLVFVENFSTTKIEYLNNFMERYKEFIRNNYVNFVFLIPGSSDSNPSHKLMQTKIKHILEKSTELQINHFEVSSI